MSTVRVAQGNISVLFPRGAFSIEDISADIMMAFQHAIIVISWQDNLPKKELPPRWMWPFPQELNTWFEEVEMIRDKDRASGEEGDVEGADMMNNEFFDDQ